MGVCARVCGSGCIDVCRSGRNGMIDEQIHGNERRRNSKKESIQSKCVKR